MKALRYGAVLVLLSAPLAACGGGSSTLTPPHAVVSATPVVKGTPVVMASPVATAMPTSAPAAVSKTETLNNGAALTNAPLATALPAPVGYSGMLAVPTVNAPAGTTVRYTSSVTAPTSLAPLAKTRTTAGVVRFSSSSTGAYDAILYDAIVPSADITVAGQVSFTQSFPAGALSSSTSYYLGFYDTTQASPTWQAIAGPVSPSGANLTFCGTVGSTTLAANKLYGFAIFSTATPTAAPPPAPQTLLYFGDGTTLTIAAEDGTVVKTLPIGSQTLDLDDSGNVYASLGLPVGNDPTSSQISMYPAGSSTASATYTPSIADTSFVTVSGSGEVAAVYSLRQNDGTLTTDVWDPGKSGAPSRTLTTNAEYGEVFAMTHDGTLYLPDHNATTNAPQFDVFPPGATTPSRVITESIIAPSNYTAFAANYAAVGPDGTLYVTEYSFAQPDALAGTYIYPADGGPERFIAPESDANGPGPQGIDVDGSGNIYVVNNNNTYPQNNTCQGDSLANVTVYSPAGTLERTVPTAPQGYPITVAADGTAFVGTFNPFGSSDSCANAANSGNGSVLSIQPNATTSTQISASGSSEIILYDGTHKTTPFASSTSHSSGGVHSGSMGGGRFRFKRH